MSYEQILEEILAERGLDEQKTPQFVKSCVVAVSPKFGNGREAVSRAFAICVSGFQKAGYLSKGSMELTDKGKKAQKRHLARKGAKGKVSEFEKILDAAKDEKEESALAKELGEILGEVHRGARGNPWHHKNGKFSNAKNGSYMSLLGKKLRTIIDTGLPSGYNSVMPDMDSDD